MYKVHILKTLMIVAILTVAYPVKLVFAQDGSSCTDDENLGYLWQVQGEDCVFDQQISFEISIAYPTEIADYDFAQQAVNTYFEERRSQFWSFANDMDFTFGFIAPWYLGISYESFHHSDTIMSLHFSESVYTGGAHPNLLFRTFTFDLATEQVLTLDDLFQPETEPLLVLQPLLQADLEEQLRERLGSISDFETDWIREGTGEEPYNYRNFVLTEDALVFYFEPYQVAAYVVGPFTVEIPLIDLAGILNEQFKGAQ